MNIFTWIYGFVGFLLFPVLMNAQGRVISIEEMERAVHPPLWKGSEILRFDEQVKKIGTMTEDDSTRVYRFRFRNVASSVVSLTKVSTSCGCTVPTYSGKPLKSEETGEILLAFNPYQQVGTIGKDVYIYTTLSGKEPVAKLTLLGEVLPAADEWVDYPVAAGHSLRLRRKKLVFREMDRSSKRVERLACVNSGNVPLKLSALMLPAYASFTTEPGIIPPGKEADLLITLDGSHLPVGKSEFSFSCILDGLDVKPSERTLHVQVSIKNEFTK